jgi:hypothetical protein
MQIRVGYELIYDCVQPTPMMLLLNVHHSRVDDLVAPDVVTTDPIVPVHGYRDGFGNWCSRLVAPRGRIRITSSALVKDSGKPDPVVLSAQQHAVQDLPDDVLVFFARQPVLRNRSSVGDRMAPVRTFSARLGTSAGDLRFRPFAHQV